jgi:hypothetical protein
MNKALAARLMLLPVVFCLAPSVASADIVKFTSGRTMSVDTCKIEDGVAVIKLREGGSMTAAASLIAEVLPDEYLHAKLETLPEFVLPAAPVSSTDDIRSLVDKLAGRHGVDAKLAHALVKVESNYQPLAVSPKGAIGLTQLMPATARELGVDEPFDAEKNLDGGSLQVRGRTGAGRLQRRGRRRGALRRRAALPGDAELRAAHHGAREVTTA